MAKEKELELHVQATAHATSISCQFPDGSIFSKTIDGNIEEIAEEDRNKILREVSIEAHTAYVTSKSKEDFASLVRKALEKKEKKKR